jgi:regulatory protein
MNDSEPVRHARAAAQRLLAYRPRSEAEVRERLSRRYPPDAVDGALESLKRAGLVDDTAFAQLWTESRVTHRPRSAALIRRELLQKGVHSDTVEAAVDGVDDAENAYRAAARLAERLRDESREVFRRRVWAHLQRRGFGSAAVRSAVSRLWDETRDGASAPPADAGCR